MIMMTVKVTIKIMKMLTTHDDNDAKDDDDGDEDDDGDDDNDVENDRIMMTI